MASISETAGIGETEAIGPIPKPACQTASSSAESVRQGIELCTMRYVLAISCAAAAIAMVAVAILA